MTTAGTGPTTVAPSAIPLNAASFTRMAGTLLGGYLVQHGLATQSDAPAMAGAIILLAVAAWHVVKNTNVVKNIIASLQAPAQTVTTPKGVAMAPVVTMLAVFLLAAPLLIGCAATGTLTNGQSLVSSSTQLTLAKTEYTGETILNLAEAAYEAAEPFFTPTQKTTVKGWIAELLALVHDARTAQTAGDATTLGQKIAAIQTLWVTIQSLTSTVTPASATPVAPSADSLEILRVRNDITAARLLIR